MLKPKNIILSILLVLAILMLFITIGMDIKSSRSLNDEQQTTNTTSNESNSPEEIESSSKKIESSDDQKSTKEYKIVVYISLIGIIILVGSMLIVSLAKEDT